MLIEFFRFILFIWVFRAFLLLGFSYLLSGYGIVPRLLNTLRTKTAFFTSENTRRLWEDIFFTGIVRNLAGIPLVHNTGFHWGNVGLSIYQTFLYQYFFTERRLLVA
jgi:hypothetical protein